MPREDGRQRLRGRGPVSKFRREFGHRSPRDLGANRSGILD